VLDLEICWLQSETSARIVNDVRAFCLENDIPVYSPALHTGYMRNLVIREGHVTGERMVNVVTRDDRPDIMRSLTERLVAAFPSITTVVNNITAKKSQVAVGETETVYHGPGSITEKIGKRLYRISANSFFQTNTAQAERLYETARVMAKLRPDDVVFDLYSGTGTIALHVADEVRHVVGIEAVASAVEDAKRNAVSNGVQNCTFLLGDLKDTLLGSRLQGTPLPHPDVILVDPPRVGMHEKVVREIRRLAPRSIVYVSCNPSTQARDMKVLCEENAYAVDEVRPVDMFPHTYHIESVASLSRTSPSA
jgi:23S rRNA (uracil1939-C5)-methyltransferase